MKKIICFVIALVLLSAGCGSPDEGGVIVKPGGNAAQPGDTNGGTASSGNPAATMNDTIYFFDADGVKIRVYDEAQAVLSSLGEPTGTFEAASCAYLGMDYFYYYDGFQLQANDVDGARRVTTVMVVDDTVSIPQGVKIGSTEEKMLELMGNGYEESGGLYKFKDGASLLQIQTKEGKVAAILYVYTS